MRSEFDVVVVGAGPAGCAAALEAAALGARVALLERQRVGGTCTLTGCVPTRALAILARLLRDIRSAPRLGIDAPPPALVWGRALARVREVVNAVAESKPLGDRLRAHRGELVLEGAARLVDPNTLRLEGTGREVRGGRIILCPGGRARRLPIPGQELAHTPEQLFELPALPPSVAIVGSGFTGVQFATILNAFGSRVVLLEAAPTLLPGADAEVAATLRESFLRQGMEVLTGIEGVDRIEPGRLGRRIHFRTRGQPEVRDVAAVFFCVGWPAAVEGLGLEAVGLSVERGFIPVDAHLRTAVRHIYVAGDGNGKDMLVQGADFEGRTAARNAVRGDLETHHRGVLPAGGFTDPDHAGVGLTEAAARAAHPGCLVGRVPLSEVHRAVIDGRPTGFFKLLADPRDGRLLGAHAAGEQALELIQTVAVALATGATIDQLSAVRFAYPSYTAVVGEAARRLDTERQAARRRS